MSADNTVRYSIYFDKPSVDLDEFCEQCQSFCDTLSNEYIWQNEAFNLQSIDLPSGLKCLCGTTNFGENINDEWFIVYLLTELTKHYDHLLVHVCDDDGEFLLIQAADELPSWLKPETSTNRVFIHKGKLHIIPQPSNPAEIPIYPVTIPDISEAYKIVLGAHNTVASDGIQKLIQQRIEGYPQCIKDAFHHAHCYIPAEIVYILQKNPHLVSNAVQAFYHRDPIDVSICSNLQIFQPQNRVTTLVKFTKHLYGQLHQANLYPNARSKWKLPNTKEKSYKAAHLGYKLTCGFEILANKSQITENKENEVEPSGRTWEQYLSNLKKNDYFQGELEGSKKYMELLTQAKGHFHETFRASSSSSDIADLIVQFMAESIEHIAEIKSANEITNLPNEDADDWLTISPDELDKMMLSMWGKGTGNKGNHGDEDFQQSGVDNLSELASRVKSFVDNVSSYEGADAVPEMETKSNDNQGLEFNNKNKHDVGFEFNNINNEDPGFKFNITSNDEQEIEFNSKEFMDCLQNLINPSKYPESNGSCESDEYEDYDSGSDVDDDFISCYKEEHLDNELAHMMRQMDMELKETNVSKSFQQQQQLQQQQKSMGGGTSKDNTEDDAPLDFDVNVIQNFLESFSSQDGLPGPVSSMLHSMGMNLPPDAGCA